MVPAKVTLLVVVTCLMYLGSSSAWPFYQSRWCPKYDNRTKPAIIICRDDAKKALKCEQGNLVPCRGKNCSTKTCHRSVIEKDWFDPQKKMCKKWARPKGDKSDCEVFYDCGRWGTVNKNRCHPQLVWQDNHCEYREKVDCKARKKNLI